MLSGPVLRKNLQNPTLSRWNLALPLLKGLTFILACGVIYIRQPMLLISPRFWAEEGAIYFSYALHNSWFRALLLPNPNFDYYSLFNNLAALMASRLVRLEYAPLVTTLLAFLIQAIPLAIVLWGNSEIYDNYIRRLLVVLIILFTLSSREIWLNTTNSPFYLLLTTALILFESMEGANLFRIWSIRLLLFFAGLTGPTSCFLTPMFYVKALLERKREYFIQAMILTFTSGVQVLVFLLVGTRLPINAQRFSQFDLATFGFIVYSRTIILPLAGLKAANWFASISLSIHNANPALFGLLGILILLVLLTTLFFAGLFSRRSIHHKKYILLVGSYALLIVITIVTSITHGNKSVLINPLWSPRYFYVPSVILLLLILTFIRPHVKGWLSIVTTILCCILLIASISIGIINYKGDLNWSEHWPKWQQEVGKYRVDTTYNELQIWPPGWSVKLDQP